ncbi:DNA-directed DNA polymerase II small subunit [Candidatus Woesearchaeota archaeon]|nr:DNA-directed DNA polymerase II small subunit [Candidatus Woesearchaeota archaeon]
MEIEHKKGIVSALMSRGVLIDSDTLRKIEQITDGRAFKQFILDDTNQLQGSVSFSDILDKYKTQSIQNINSDTEKIPEGVVKITFSYQGEPKKREVQDFTNYFISRYNALKSILQNRKELQNLTSISRLNQKREREQTAIIGIISDKQVTKTGKLVLNVEDTTGQIKAIISPNSDSFETAKECVHDEVIGIVGLCTGSVIFANNIIIPDVPAFKEVKKSPDEAYALFMGDFHFGSKVFLHEPFDKFMSWLNGHQGNEAQREVVKKIKYLFMVGDLVEGVGIYPDQEKDLEILDIYEQYNEFAKHLKRIPPHIKIIICPGNHDAMRIAEPQPPLYKDFAEAVYKLPNVIMVSNPSYLNIHSSENFTGFDVLMYHGFSYPTYADIVESIRSQGGQKRPDLIMKFLLQRRHLAPAHKSTLYLPDANKDPLVIDKVPDFFVSGHIHRVSAANYRNVTLLNCSSWLKRTEYQEKVGIYPQPGRALLVNLQTRKVKILKFYDDPTEKEEDAPPETN